MKTIKKHWLAALLIVGLVTYSVTKNEPKEDVSYINSIAQLVRSTGGHGTCVLYDKEEGLFITNHHVIDEDSVFYALYNGDTIHVEVVYSSEARDLAIVKAVAGFSVMEEMSEAEIGNSDKLEPFDMVRAIGFPFWEGITYTEGVFAGTKHMEDYDMPFLLKIDAQINPGNSGGGLFNERGELVGINSAGMVIYALNGRFGVYGYAIPSNVVKTFIAEYAS